MLISLKNKEVIGTIRRDANLSARALSTRIDLNEGYINRLESKWFIFRIYKRM